MNSEWKDVILGDIVEVKQGLAINAKSKHLLVDDGMPLLRITDLLNDNQVQFINAKEAPKQCLANADDLIYTRTGQVGYVFRGKVGVVHNNCFRVIPKTDSTTRGFLYWFLSQNKIRQYANDIASGSVQKDLNHSAFYSIPLSIPSKVTQLRIEKILNSIEDKIELNRKMNQTLEEIAQALFKSWFVDFDPVHAKAKCSSDEELETAACELGISKEILELFPSEFEESELGMIPKGWEVINLSQHVKVTKGKSYKSSELQDSTTSLVTLKSFLRGGGYRTDGLKSYIGTYKPEQVVKPGEMIIAYTDVTQAADVIGKPAIVLDDETVEVFVASLDVGIIRTITDQVSKMFLYHLFKTPSFQGYILGYTSGTTVLHLAKAWLDNFETFLPNIEIMDKFDGLVQPMFNRINENIQQLRTLQKTRDTLLPKLLSGELDVSELELDMKGN